MSDTRNILSPDKETDNKSAKSVSESHLGDTTDRVHLPPVSDESFGEPLGEAHEKVIVIWGRVSAAMKQDLGEAIWQAWIKNLTPVALSEKGLVLQAGTSFIRNRVQSQYAEKLRFMLKREYGTVQQISVTVKTAQPYPACHVVCVRRSQGLSAAFIPNGEGWSASGTVVRPDKRA